MTRSARCCSTRGAPPRPSFASPIAHIDRLERPAARHALSLSEAVAEPLIDAHFVRVSLAEQPSEQAMMGLALSFLRDQNAS